MSETVNIGRKAELISKDIFKEFLWERTGPMNWNWPCEDEENHKHSKHPTDVVYFYDEPYSPSRCYVNCDLKSYAKGTINTSSILPAIESLSRSLCCAEKSTEWRNKYIHDHVSPEICGLLFVYNHDGGYDRDFYTMLRNVDTKKINIPKRTKIVVMGPQDVFWLDNVRHEIAYMRGGEEILPERSECRYFFPHLRRKNNLQLEHAKSATLEMLTSPWIILTYSNEKRRVRNGVVVFYKRKGETPNEFLYLIDYLMHYQVLNDKVDEIHVKVLEPSGNAHASFHKAVSRYIEDCDGSADIKNILELITFSQISHVRSTFSELEIGMES